MSTAYCGNCRLRPSHRLVRTEYVVLMAHMFDTVGFSYAYAIFAPRWSQSNICCFHCRAGSSCGMPWGYSLKHYTPPTHCLSFLRGLGQFVIRVFHSMHISKTVSCMNIAEVWTKDVVMKGSTYSSKKSVSWVLQIISCFQSLKTMMHADHHFLSDTVSV